MNCAVIIPALNPESSLIEFVKRLLKKGIAHVIIVNDGSNRQHLQIFQKLTALSQCTVLVHQKNRGKGRALKTGFRYFLKRFKTLKGVITADADGQHSVDDVCHMANALTQNPNCICLGTRNFDVASVPPRSYLGNKITCMLFHFLFHYRLKDTQTGLRGIPSQELPWMLDLKGERYEYEINMLIQSVRRKVRLCEINIETIYINRNRGSNYHSVRDSVRILYRLIAGFFRRKSMTRHQQMNGPADS